MFEEYQKQEEIKVLKSLGVIKQYCNFHQNHNKGCEKCMLYDVNRELCLLCINDTEPNEWDLIIKMEL